MKKFWKHGVSNIFFCVTKSADARTYCPGSWAAGELGQALQEEEVTKLVLGSSGIGWDRSEPGLGWEVQGSCREGFTYGWGRGDKIHQKDWDLAGAEVWFCSRCKTSPSWNDRLLSSLRKQITAFPLSFSKYFSFLLVSLSVVEIRCNLFYLFIRTWLIFSLLYQIHLKDLLFVIENGDEVPVQRTAPSHGLSP